MNEDTELLRRYADDRDETAFAELVRRHVNLVYGAALRQLNGDAHLAADAVQLVFADLARKAPALADRRVLAGWLFTSTRYTTAKLVRTERRRQRREHEAGLMRETMHDDGAAEAQRDWQRVRPVLDEALGALGAADREALLLRFFEGRDYAGLAARLQIAENAARMRVGRALDKLRARLARRGVTSTAAALGLALSGHAAAALAPTGLAGTATTAALAAGATTATSASAVFFMGMTKLQIGAAAAVALAGVAGYVTQAETAAALQTEIAALRAESGRIAALRAENTRLAQTVAETERWRGEAARVAALGAEATALPEIAARATATANARAAKSRSTVVGEVLDIRLVDRPPKPVFQARPQYPAALRSTPLEGEVRVDFIVDAEGAVRDLRVVRSTNAVLEPAVTEAVAQWRFEPAAKGGQAVNARMQLPVRFTQKRPGSPTGVTQTPPQSPFWF
jgi:RNA polymerase sigma factor (sigma-70 family)